MRVMIAEDNVLLREGVVRLHTESDIEAAGTSGNADNSSWSTTTGPMLPSSTFASGRPTPTRG
jgi:hypothetical protein